MPNFFSQYQFEHPTQSILESLNREIEAWCKNHHVEITQQTFGIRETHG